MTSGGAESMGWNYWGKEKSKKRMADHCEKRGLGGD